LKFGFLAFGIYPPVVGQVCYLFFEVWDFKEAFSWTWQQSQKLVLKILRLRSGQVYPNQNQ